MPCTSKERRPDGIGGRQMKEPVSRVAIALTLIVAIGIASGCKKETPSEQTGPVQESETAQSTAKIDLDVLYVGRPGSERENDFRGFLSTHFARVATSNGETFDGTEAQGFDVVVFDCNAPHLPEGFGRPSVTIGLDGMRLFAKRGVPSGFW